MVPGRSLPITMYEPSCGFSATLFRLFCGSWAKSKKRSFLAAAAGNTPAGRSSAARAAQASGGDKPAPAGDKPGHNASEDKPATVVHALAVSEAPSNVGAEGPATSSTTASVLTTPSKKNCPVVGMTDAAPVPASKKPSKLPPYLNARVIFASKAKNKVRVVFTDSKLGGVPNHGVPDEYEYFSPFIMLPSSY